MNHRKELARFAFEHLPEPLQQIAEPFYDLAEFVCSTLPNNAERNEALTLLLKAKDCAVRAVLFM